MSTSLGKIHGMCRFSTRFKSFVVHRNPEMLVMSVVLVVLVEGHLLLFVTSHFFFALHSSPGIRLKGLQT